MHKDIFYLQMFADGGADAGGEGGATATEGAVSTEGTNATDSAEGSEVQKMSFDDLIKGEYKKEYEAKLQSAMEKRFKAANKDKETVGKLAPVLELLGRKYGVDASDLSKLDIDALTNTILEDDSYYEEEAMNRGVSVEALKEIRRMERENATLKQTIEERTKRENSERAYAELVNQANGVKAVYPNFDLNAEMQNPSFGRLVANGVPLQTAYEVVHKNEILPAAMQFAVQKTQENISKSIQSGKNRPSENGVGNSVGFTTKLDPSKLTPEERADIRRRVLERGEKITF